MKTLYLTPLAAALAWPAQAADSDTLAPVVVQHDAAATVTAATGLPLTPQETPQAVSVITQERLQAQGIDTLSGAMRNTTGINVVRSGGREHYMSRGFYVDQFAEDGISTTIGAPGVAGSPARDPRRITDLSMYERIEVVRGAPGLATANSEPGGTISAVRKRPTDDTHIGGDLTLDRFGKTRATLDASGTLSAGHGLRGRGVVALDNGRTFQKRVKGNNAALYGVLDKTVGTAGTLTLGGYYQYQRQVPDVNGLPQPADFTLPRKTYLGAAWNKDDIHKWGGFTAYEHRFNDDWKAGATLEYRRERSRDRYAYLDGTVSRAAPEMAEEDLHRDRRNSTQLAFKADLNGTYHALGRSHELYAAYDYNREKNHIDYDRIDSDSTHNIFTYTGDIARPDWAKTDFTSATDSNFTTHSLTLSSRFNATDDLHLIGGARYTRWQRPYHYRSQKTGAAADETHKTYKNNRLIPFLGATWDLGDNHSLYASYASIFKPQANLDINGNVMPPAIGRSYEIGWKGSWRDGGLNAGIALFQTEQHDRQINSGKRNAAGQRYWIPMDVVSRGVDAEIGGDVNEQLRLYGGYTYNISKYKESGGSISKGMNFSAQTPRHLLRLYGDYRLPFAEKWRVGAGVNWQSRIVSSWNSEQGSYALWQAGVHYDASDKLSLGLAIDNLTDKRYYSTPGAAGFGNYYGEPRNAMLTFRWNL